MKKYLVIEIENDFKPGKDYKELFTAMLLDNLSDANIEAKKRTMCLTNTERNKKRIFVCKITEKEFASLRPNRVYAEDTDKFEMCEDGFDSDKEPLIAEKLNDLMEIMTSKYGDLVENRDTSIKIYEIIGLIHKINN